MFESLGWKIENPRLHGGDNCHNRKYESSHICHLSNIHPGKYGKNAAMSGNDVQKAVRRWLLEKVGPRRSGVRTRLAKEKEISVSRISKIFGGAKITPDEIRKFAEFFGESPPGGIVVVQRDKPAPVGMRLLSVLVAFREELKDRMTALKYPPERWNELSKLQSNVDAQILEAIYEETGVEPGYILFNSRSGLTEDVLWKLLDASTSAERVQQKQTPARTVRRIAKPSASRRRPAAGRK